MNHYEDNSTSFELYVFIEIVKTPQYEYFHVGYIFIILLNSTYMCWSTVDSNDDDVEWMDDDNSTRYMIAIIFFTEMNCGV